LILAFDGAPVPPAVAARLATIGGREVLLDSRRGPGAARNRGAADARGEYLAFTEDDCEPQPDWLDRAAAALGARPAIDVLVGATISPDGRPTRRPDGNRPHYLPTNLFVRNDRFRKAGGYCEDFFDRGGIYFREDSDFGFTLEEAGAIVAVALAARVTHPTEHPRFLDPLRWARRYEMDALLQSRHPELFRQRIEVHRIGPFTVRRLFVRACFGYALALAAAAVAVLAGESGLAVMFGAVAAGAFLAIWAKWRFDLPRFPVIALAPFVLIWSYARGRFRRRA
jgi:glycosyltransferase involved in cell wall biosynthesis